MALFDSPQTLRQPQISSLTDALRTKLPFHATSGPAGDVQHVLDGGVQLHRIPWPQDSATYQDIYVSGLYCSYATKKYGNTIVWFGGYDGISTKNMMHQRRAAGKARATVTFHGGLESNTQEGKLPRQL